MRCFKDYKNDRTCDLCSAVNYITFSECYLDYIEKKNYMANLLQIKKNCPHLRKNCFEDREYYDGCARTSSYHRPPSCNPKLECQNYKNDKSADK